MKTKSVLITTYLLTLQGKVKDNTLYVAIYSLWLSLFGKVSRATNVLANASPSTECSLRM